MNAALVGGTLAAASLIVAIACLAWGAVLVLRLSRHLDALMSKPAVRALEKFEPEIERISASMERLGGLGRRVEVISREVYAALESGTRFAAGVRLVAAATEDLLDALMPSMRGVAKL